MADKVPVKATFSGTNVTGLAEFTTSDTVGISQGGTGATTAAGARTNLSVIGTTETATLTNKTVFGKLSGTSDQGTMKTITVTVASKTSAHPNSGGSSSAYFLDGIEAPFLNLTQGTYRFDQADGTNSTHPLRFYLDDAKGTAFTTGVTTNGTAGSAGAYTQIVVDDTTPFTLSYQCSSHGYMGSYVHVGGTTTILGQTIDSDSNTITNIVNADIKSSAAIALSKLATTTASRALVSSGTGAISVSDVTSTEIEFLDGSTAGTVVNSKAVIYSGTGTIAGTLSTAAQTNITSVGALDGGSITSGFGTIDTGSSTITTTGNITGGTLTSSGTVVIANGGNIGSASDTDAIEIATNGNVTLSQNLTVTGDLTVSGTTTTVNSTTVSIKDPIFELGDSSSDDNLDRGIKMKYNSSGAKIAFMGFDDSDSKFTMIPDATDSTNVFSGTVGTLKANIEGNLTGTIQTAAQTNITSVGALDGGSITSGFGSINNGSSAITTTGTITYGTLNDGTTSLAATVAELNTTADGNTTIGTTSVSDGHGIVMNHGGTMAQTTVQTLAAYLDDEITAMPNLVTTAATTVGALNSGSITSGFGTIDTGSSTITTTGAISGGSLVISNGGNIGSAGDTDAISIASDGTVTISGDLVVSGTTQTQNSTNLDVSANLIQVNSGLTTANTNDSGLVIERGSTGDNAIFVWDESEDKFIVGTTTATSTSTGNLTITTGTLVANLEGNVTGTLQTAAQGNITSLGTLTTLTVDNVIVNGTTIGHTSDTDLLTLADGVVTVAGEISATTLDIGGTNITATATELNLLDGVSGLVQADFTKLAAVDSTATELNIVDGDTTIGTTAVSDGHGIVMNHGGTMAQTTVQTLAAYLDDEITAMPNLTSVGTLTTLTVDNVIINGTNIGHTSDTDAIAIASGGAVTFSQNPVFPTGGVDITSLDIDGAGSSVTTLADADLFIVDDGAGGTNKKVAASVIKTYAGGGITVQEEGSDLGATGSGTTLNFVGDAVTASGTGATKTITVADESLINAIIFG